MKGPIQGHPYFEALYLVKEPSQALCPNRSLPSAETIDISALAWPVRISAVKLSAKMFNFGFRHSKGRGLWVEGDI